MEKFLLEIIDGVPTSWDFIVKEQVRSPAILTFRKNSSEKFLIKNIDFTNFSINFKYENKSEQILLPINLIPSFTEKITKCGESNFQLAFKRENEDYFNETDKIIDECLMFGEKIGVKLSVIENKVIVKVKNKEKYNIEINDITQNYLGNLVLDCSTIEELGYSLTYKKLIPQHKIKEYKLLSKINLHTQKSILLNINEEDFLQRIVKMESDYFSKIAFKYLLSTKLEEKTNKRKIIKI